MLVYVPAYAAIILRIVSDWYFVRAQFFILLNKMQEDGIRTITFSEMLESGSSQEL